MSFQRICIIIILAGITATAIMAYYGSPRISLPPPKSFSSTVGMGGLKPSLSRYRVSHMMSMMSTMGSTSGYMGMYLGSVGFPLNNNNWSITLHSGGLFTSSAVASKSFIGGLSLGYTPNTQSRFMLEYGYTPQMASAIQGFDFMGFPSTGYYHDPGAVMMNSMNSIRGIWQQHIGDNTVLHMSVNVYGLPAQQSAAFD